MACLHEETSGVELGGCGPRGQDKKVKGDKGTPKDPGKGKGQPKRLVRKPGGDWAEPGAKNITQRASAEKSGKEEQRTEREGWGE